MAPKPKLKNKVKKIIKLDDRRKALMARIDAVNAKYQPKIDRLMERRDQRTSKARAKVRHLNTQILTIVITMNGTERGQLRTHRPIKEMEGR